MISATIRDIAIILLALETLVVIALLSGAVAWLQARRSARESAKLLELSAHLRDERNRAETASRAKRALPEDSRARREVTFAGDQVEVNLPAGTYSFANDDELAGTTGSCDSAGLQEVAVI